MHAILIATAALVGLPVLLHLIMKQEPKRLPFPALRFLLQKKKTNQRKMKLKHFLLLALRMLLIALFGLALFQPKLAPTGLAFGITLSGEEPVAAVIIIDTSPSMGYLSAKQTRLTEAVKRARELLDELPANSKVMIVDPSQRGGDWEKSVDDARNKLDAMKEPSGAAVPLTNALELAYDKLRTADKAGGEPMPRLVAVFSDRTAACWIAERTEELSKARDLVPPPAVAHLFVDVGIDQPSDVGITSVEFEPQVIAQGQPMVFTVTVRASGPAVEAMVKCKVTPLAGDAPMIDEQANRVVIDGNSQQQTRFTLPDQKLKPGVYQAELKLEKNDNLLFNDTRFVTFKVAEPKKLLTVSDDPEDAKFWQLAHEAKGEFQCTVVKTSEVPKLADYDAVAVLSVTDPSKLWPELLKYVEGGGKLIILPGGESQVLPTAYQASTNEAAAKLLPAELKEVFDSNVLPEPYKSGLSWRIDEKALKQPMLAPFVEWRKIGNIDVLVNPPKAWKHWSVKVLPGAQEVVYYSASADGAKDPPAVIERAVGKGKVVLLTTRMDSPKEDATQKWHDYWSSDGSWMLVLPNLILKHLLGSIDDEKLNFTTGTGVSLPLPRGAVTKVTLNGPGVLERDSVIEIDPEKREARLAMKFANTAGSFRVLHEKWKDGFSLNAPPEESDLSKVEIPLIEALLGEGSVVAAEKKMPLKELLKLKYNQPIDLFPWLLILVLFLLVTEAYIANRFYRNREMATA